MVEKPTLRQNIEIIPVIHENETGILLSDHLMPGQGIFVGKKDILLLTFFDGKHTARDIQYQATKQQDGVIIPIEEIKEFIRILDENGFLDSDQYRKMIADLFDEYKSKPDRSSLMLMETFSDNQSLEEYLDSKFQGVEEKIVENLPEKVRGLMVPHIDVERGRISYVHSYQTLRKYPEADCYIVLGVNHSYPTGNPFIATDRNYATPLGGMDTDMEMLNKLNHKLDWDLLDGELAHRGEHSVEFPTLFLNYIYPGIQAKMLPILCNFIDKEDPKIDLFVHALKEIIEQDPRNIILIASVDFTHAGAQFGWQKEVDEIDRVRIKREDMETLEFMAKNDPDGFYNDIMKDQNARNIDALGAGYVFLKLLPDIPGRLINYEQAFHPHNTVTFAGMIF
ncbi:MAG: AmmeMemoRadiSam system protein B [Candidatus Cloacimonetes bacterium 4572_55]|nr:MAG: AmmeMemoRadiSam system protein B [Candidatus Cloacimonetes bacterium 4572_55]